MGQRHQYVIVYPKVFYNKGNPNNKPERAEVFHHQWLYGRSAILALWRVLRLANNSWDGGDRSDYMFGRSGSSLGDGTRAIAAAVSVDPDEGYYHNVWIWKPEDWNAMEDNNGGLGEENAGAIKSNQLKSGMFDNNDGITLIQFEKGERLPKVAFITPSHLEGSHWKNSDGKGPWTAREYLAFYYDQAEQAEWEAELREHMEKALAEIERLSRPFKRGEVAKLVPGIIGAPVAVES